jgi:hypothetical protein
MVTEIGDRRRGEVRKNRALSQFRQYVNAEIREVLSRFFHGARGVISGSWQQLERILKLQGRSRD